MRVARENDHALHLRRGFQHRAGTQKSRHRVPNDNCWPVDNPDNWRTLLPAPVCPPVRTCFAGSHAGLSGNNESRTRTLQSGSRLPLDGGRILRSIIWKPSGNLQTATRVATVAGQMIAYFLILIGIWLFFGGDVLGGGFIGWFLLSGVQSANAQVQLESMLQGTTVSEAQSRHSPCQHLIAKGSRRSLVTAWLAQRFRDAG